MAVDPYALFFDADRCFGCRGCEVACQQEHDLGENEKWIRIIQVGPRQVEGQMMMRFVPRMCMHCHAPLCLKACPVGAIVRDPQGLVRIDARKCNGCLECTWACPFGVVFFDGEKGRVGKCDFCFDRIARGEAPSCVRHCPAKAIRLERGGSGIVAKDRLMISSGLVKMLYSPSPFSLAKSGTMAG